MSRYKDYLMEKEENLDNEIIKLNAKINSAQSIIDRSNDTWVIDYWVGVRDSLTERQQELTDQKTGISY